MTQHIEEARKVWGYFKGGSAGGTEAMQWFDNNKSCGGPAYLIEVFRAALAAAEERGRLEERGRCARIEELERQNEAWRRNSIDTRAAMVAMRNDINQHVPLPSLDSDLLQGPENSVFCATVASAVAARIAELEKRLADAERVIEPFNKMAGELFARNFVDADNVIVMQAADKSHIKVTFRDFRAARAYMKGRKE
ncbi:MAG: hypothetical protein WC455_14965 [Dehalococcoidia bacterium]|jgi:hypothetical protein